MMVSQFYKLQIIELQFNVSVHFLTMGDYYGI